MRLPQRRQCKLQLLQREQPMEEGTHGKQLVMRLPQEEQLVMRLPQERQPVVRLPQGEQQMAELLLRRQYEVQLLQGEVGEGEGTHLLLNLHLSLSQQETS
jgi:hypothetical protein